MMELIVTFFPLICLLFLLYFFLLRPQKKRDNANRDMRNSLRPGDEILTIGGIYGKIMTVKDESVVIQVGSDKVKFEMAKWAIKTITSDFHGVTAKDAVVEPKEEVAPEPKKPAKPKKLLNLDFEKEDPIFKKAKQFTGQPVYDGETQASTEAVDAEVVEAEVVSTEETK